MPQLAHWVEDGKPDPDVNWPKDWEVCVVPNRNPFAIKDEDKRPGSITLAMPNRVLDMVEELTHLFILGANAGF